MLMRVPVLLLTSFSYRFMIVLRKQKEFNSKTMKGINNALFISAGKKELKGKTKGAIKKIDNHLKGVVKQSPNHDKTHYDSPKVIDNAETVAKRVGRDKLFPRIDEKVYPKLFEQAMEGKA